MASWQRRRAAIAMVGLVLAAGCAEERPQLVDAPPAATAPAPTAAPTAEIGPTSSPTAAPPAPTPTPGEAERRGFDASERGVDDDAIRIGVVGTASFFPGFGDAVRARVTRANRDGGIAGRVLEVVDIVDDGGDAVVMADALTRLVEVDEVFAVVVPSTALSPENASYLEERQVPFFGWGFTGGFCEPNVWGFGFNGCLAARSAGLADPAVAGPGRALAEAFGRPATAVLVTTDDAAGRAAVEEATAAWGEDLLDVDQLPADAAAIAGTGAGLVLARIPPEPVAELTADLRAEGFDGLVLADSTYLPGLLADPVIAEQLDRTWALTQFPPREELRQATQRILVDLIEIDAAGADPDSFPLTVGHAVAYWSTDLLVGLLEAVGGELDTATFFDRVAVDGVGYDSGLDGGPCPVDTATIHRTAAAGGAVLQILDGLYQPTIPFTCY